MKKYINKYKKNLSWPILTMTANTCVLFDWHATNHLYCHWTSTQNQAFLNINTELHLNHVPENYDLSLENYDLSLQNYDLSLENWDISLRLWGQPWKLILALKIMILTMRIVTFVIFVDYIFVKPSLPVWFTYIFPYSLFNSILPTLYLPYKLPMSYYNHLSSTSLSSQSIFPINV